MHDLEHRRIVAEAAMARFRADPFQFGSRDCVRLGAFVLRKRRHRVQLGKAGSYSTALGARRALDRAGFATLEDALDSYALPRIGLLSTLPCDLVLIPGEGPFGGALMMAVGNGRVFGYHEDLVGADVLQPDPSSYIGAWRV